MKKDKGSIDKPGNIADLLDNIGQNTANILNESATNRYITCLHGKLCSLKASL